MKKNVLIAACLSVMSMAAFCQTQVVNGSFDTWESATCGTKAFEQPKGLAAFIDPCIRVSTNVETVYNLDLHTTKVAGEAIGSTALKLVNTQGANSVNNYLGVGITTGLTKVPSAIEVSFKSDIKLNDSMSITFFAYKGTGEMSEVYSDKTERTHFATYYFTKSNNKTTFSKVTIPLKEIVDATPNVLTYIINTKGNDENDYEANINSSIIIDEIKFKYEVPTATIIPAATIMFAGSDLQAFSLVINSDVAWTAKSDSKWLTVQKSSGDAGQNQMSFNVGSNVGAERSAVITISGEGAKNQTVTVYQEAGTTGAGLAVVEPYYPLSYKASEDNFLIKTTSAWKIENMPSWLTLSATSGTGNVTIKVTAPENTGIERDAALSVIIPDVDTQTVEITQLPASPTLAVNATKITLNDIADNAKKISVTSNTFWTVYTSASWLAVSSKFGYHDASFVVYAMKNTGAARSATILVKGDGLDAKEIVITQSAAGTTPVVTPEEPVVDPVSPKPTAISAQATTEASLIYPNPANDQFFVKTNDKAVVAVYSQTNELLIEKTITTNSSIDISTLSKGTYVVIVSSEESQYKTVLIKQ